MGPTIHFSTMPSGWAWASSQTSANMTFSDRCPVADAFQMRVYGGVMRAGESVWARWSAAPGTYVTGLTMTWQAYADLNPARGQGTVRIVLKTDQQTLYSSNSPLSIEYGYFGDPRFHAALAPATQVELSMTCLDQCSGSSSPWAVMDVLDAWLDVDDSSSPVAGLTGSAIEAGTWSGVMPFRMTAVDIGGGLARAVVQVDGVDARSIPLGNANTCHDIGHDPAAHEYAAAQPCPARIDDQILAVDTTGLSQGEHEIRILVEDAAGNRTTVFGPVTRNIAANRGIGPGSDPALRGAANGSAATDQARLTAHWGRRSLRTSLVSAFGHAHVVRGRLTTQDGEPIDGAALDVTSKTTAVNARALAKRAGPRTGSDGSWFLVLPRGVSSRDLTFRYRSHLNDTIASASAGVRLRVRAGVRLAIRPRRARQGQTIRFSGRLLGGPVPRGGKQVVLMARASRGAWVRFNVVRTDATGRFGVRYRFHQPGPALYRFRALSLAEAAYPYLAGGSNVVSVRES